MTLASVPHHVGRRPCYSQRIQNQLSFPVRFASSTSNTNLPRNNVKEVDDLGYIRKHYVVHKRGDIGNGSGSREYLLLPPHRTIKDAMEDKSLKAASLMAHRNIIFGARVFVPHDNHLQQPYSLRSGICLPLVDRAVQDAGENGEQPQAIASLAGLCSWVTKCLETGESAELETLRSTDAISFDAVQSIATGIPKPGNPGIGIGTYRDAEAGWKKLATEFVNLGLSDEAALYRERGARLVAIEHLADKNPRYLASAGGAMARLFFL